MLYTQPGGHLTGYPTPIGTHDHQIVPSGREIILLGTAEDQTPHGPHEEQGGFYPMTQIFDLSRRLPERA